jgi:uncharacterized Zn-finger protein
MIELPEYFFGECQSGVPVGQFDDTVPHFSQQEPHVLAPGGVSQPDDVGFGQHHLSTIESYFTEIGPKHSSNSLNLLSPSISTLKSVPSSVSRSPSSLGCSSSSSHENQRSQGKVAIGRDNSRSVCSYCSKTFANEQRLS